MHAPTCSTRTCSLGALPCNSLVNVGLTRMNLQILLQTLNPHGRVHTLALP
jgi:hypothetical protein